MVGDCSKCARVLPLATANKSRKTGEQLYRSWCRECEHARKHQWNTDNRDHRNAKSAAWVQNNLELRAAISRRSRAKVPKEVTREIQRAWRAANPERARAEVNARRRALRHATPRALSELDRLFISEIYHAAQLRKLTVDHIVPLQHPLVCGLHTPANLQLLSSTANFTKSNSGGGLRAQRTSKKPPR